MTTIQRDYLERCYAGWLGKVIGVRHGAPIEGWTYERIMQTYGELDSYLVDYREFAADDDTNGPMFFLRALLDEPLDNPRDVTAAKIGDAWLNYAAFEHGMFWWGGYGKSTEHTAYLNLRAGIPAPRAGSVEQNGAAVAEQIGGQIFIDTWGLICPGDPALAAEFATKAASVSHGGNGIYGGVFVASAIAAAFDGGSIQDIIQTALAQIPADCEYARVAQDIIAFHSKEADWHSCMRHIIANWGYDRYPGNCHIIPNAAVMIMAMLYGNGDYSRTINICNTAGWDTDCNVGNVGTILGVLCGLGGIDKKWSDPVHDFLAASSVVGSLNIMDLPDNVRTMARIAYRIAGQEIPPETAAFLNGPRFSFELPGSTHAFRADIGGEEKIEVSLMNTDEAAASGKRCLKAAIQGADAGKPIRIYHQTYYRPKHFHDNRYDPAFSPILYPGQRVSAMAMIPKGGKPVAARAYALDSNSGERHYGAPVPLAPGIWSEVAIEIEPMSGACIEQAGIEITTPEAGCLDIYIDDMDFSGNANYKLDFSKERIEAYTNLHREVSQTTYVKGIWALEDGQLAGSCADFGACFTGDVRWRDVEVTCSLTPENDGLCGFLFRAQGAVRGYSVALEGGQLLLQKNTPRGWLTLASTNYPYAIHQERIFTVKAQGNHLQVSEAGKPLLEAADNDQPYRNGMVGFRVERGGRCLYAKMAVKSS